MRNFILHDSIQCPNTYTCTCTCTGIYIYNNVHVHVPSARCGVCAILLQYVFVARGEEGGCVVVRV